MSEKNGEDGEKAMRNGYGTRKPGTSKAQRLKGSKALGKGGVVSDSSLQLP